MRKFVLECVLPGAGNMTSEEIENLRHDALDAISKSGKNYIWFESFVTEDKVYCIHGAETVQDVRNLINYINLPVNSIEEVKIIIGPTITN